MDDFKNKLLDSLRDDMRFGLFIGGSMHGDGAAVPAKAQQLLILREEGEEPKVFFKNDRVIDKDSLAFGDCYVRNVNCFLTEDDAELYLWVNIYETDDDVGLVLEAQVKDSESLRDLVRQTSLETLYDIYLSEKVMNKK